MVTATVVTVLPLPTVNLNVSAPRGAWRRTNEAVKEPSSCVNGAGSGKAPTPPMISDDTGAKPGTFSKLTTNRKPGWVELGLSVTDAPGTAWVAQADRPAIAAVTFFDFVDFGAPEAFTGLSDDEDFQNLFGNLFGGC